MKSTPYIAPLICWGALLFTPGMSPGVRAQPAADIELSVFASSLFIDNTASSRFFDGPSFSVSYSREVIPFLDAYIALGALNAMETSGETNLGLDRYSVSILNLNLGLELILLRNTRQSFAVGMSAGIRNRKETSHDFAVQWSEEQNLTSDNYINTLDYGSLVHFGYRRIISGSVTIGVASASRGSRWSPPRWSRVTGGSAISSWTLT